MRMIIDRLRGQRGFSMPTVMGAMLAAMSISLVAFASAGGDQHGARYDQNQKLAYAAAEAGIHEYLFHLNDDEAYWTKCDGPDVPAWIGQPWNGSDADTSDPDIDDPRVRRNVPGSDAQYTIELLPVEATCDPTDSTSMIDTQSGTFRIRSTGFVRNAKRSIIGTFRRRGFLDFLWYTDLETQNPVTYKVQTGGYPSKQTPSSSPTPPDAQALASANCSKYYDQRKNWTATVEVTEPSGTKRNLALKCNDINFITGDGIEGPLHTNDQLLVCGAPIFGRNVGGVKDAIEVVHPSGYRYNTGCSGNNANFVGEKRFNAPLLNPPPVVSMKSIAETGGYIYTGKTTIQLNGGSLRITNGSTTVDRAYPPNGVIYVANGAGACGFYDATRTDVVNLACGDVEVRGTYAKDLTIAAERDIVVTGDVIEQSGSNAMMGLIAENFVRVGHRVTHKWNGSNGQYPRAKWNSSVYDWTWTESDGDFSCKNVAGSWPNRIDAAILAISHSFIVDNWFCGAALGTLTVNGAIAQKYRGIVGTFGSSDTGFLKDYNYDDELKYRQPPHFLYPIQTSWRVIRQTEQAPAR
jgi:hypothetical protein